MLEGFVRFRPDRDVLDPAQSDLVDIGTRGEYCVNSGLDVYPLNGDGWFVGDVRLDNRTELIGRLNISAARAEGMSDTALVAQAYDAWGTDCGHHVLGSWSFAAWHPEARRLILARDAFGFNALYYHISPAGIRFADRMPALLAHTEIKRQLNLSALAQLSYGAKRDTSSFYRNIHKVPPATVLIFNEGIPPRRHRYWDPGDVSDVRLGSDDEYRDAFLEIYRAAVAAKLNSKGPFGITLSGGLDSGSTAALAVPILAERGERLKAFTWIPGGETPDVTDNRTPDEWANVQRLAAFCGGIDLTAVPGYPVSPLKAVRHMLDITQEPGNPLAGWSWYYGVLQQAGRSGIETLLTGEAGNYTVSIDKMERRRSFWRRNYRRLQKRWNARQSNEPSHFRMIVRPEFAQQILDASQPADPELYGKWKTAPQPLRSAYNVLQSGGLNVSREIARHFGVDIQTPAMARRLFEFCYAIPPEQYARSGESRILIRHALAGIMPREQLWDKRRGQIAGNLNQILSHERDEIMAIIETAKSSPITREALDLDWMERLADEVCLTEDGEDRRISSGVLLMRGLTYAIFLERFNDAGEGTE